MMGTTGRRVLGYWTIRGKRPSDGQMSMLRHGRGWPRRDLTPQCRIGCKASRHLYARRALTTEEEIVTGQAGKECAVEEFPDAGDRATAGAVAEDVVCY